MEFLRDNNTVKFNGLTYDVIILENWDILLKKKEIIIDINKDNSDEISDYNFTYSEIINCKVNETVIDKLKYRNIINNIYNIINNGAKIIKYNSFKDTSEYIQTGESKENGFYYLKHLGISIRNVDSNINIKEIVSQCKNNKIKIEMKIKLKNNSFINIII